MRKPEEILFNNIDVESYIDVGNCGFEAIIKSMKEFGLEVAKQTQINCANNAHCIFGNNEFGYFSKVNKESILDEKNIPEI